MKDFVGQCDVCLTHRDLEPLLQHEVPPRPWAKVAADICFHSGRALLVVVDYFSNFIEVDSLSSETSKSVIRSLMALHRFGVPDSLVTDNGPCFASSEFAKFVTFSMLLRVPVTRKVMVRPRMPFVLLNVCSRSVESLVSVSSRLSWIGVILRVRAWIRALHNVF